MFKETPFSLTKHLLSFTECDFKDATQSPFLLSAAQGEVDKETLRKWLMDDRKYIHLYIKSAEDILASIQRGSNDADDDSEDKTEIKLGAWFTEAIANVRREEEFFVDVAERYGIDLDPRPDDGELPSLLLFEDLFKNVPISQDRTEPWWLGGAILFWATEVCYLEAWSWAKSQLNDQSAADDADGGALRKEFIPNWTSAEFAKFVERLADIIDEAVNRISNDSEHVQNTNPPTSEDYLESLTQKETIIKRSRQPLSILMRVLEAEKGFWPMMG